MVCRFFLPRRFDRVPDGSAKRAAGATLGPAACASRQRQSRTTFSLAFSYSFLTSWGESFGRSIASVILWILPVNVNGGL
jgi:hypothetical protein